MELGTGTTDANIDEWLEVYALADETYFLKRDPCQALTPILVLPCRALRLHREANPRRSRPEGLRRLANHLRI